jgi:DNA polymerase-3 subunit delta'
MNLAACREAARQGRLYPALILHGGAEQSRQSAALELGRLLLCEAEPVLRPCAQCRHCRRIAWPSTEAETAFHPDFHVLLRDLKTSTSVEATRALLREAQTSPFEARGQVFVVANAETLSGEAANALLKTLEEPPSGAPRHFFLLAPSRLDLLPTLRSRSLAVFLGAAEPVARETALELAAAFSAALSRYAAGGGGIYLLAAAQSLARAGGWEDPRASRPWALAAAAVVRSLDEPGVAAANRRSRLALAEALLEAPAWRLRGIPAERILEGLAARHLRLHP